MDPFEKLTQLAIEKERLAQTKFLKEQEIKQPSPELIPPTATPQSPVPSSRAKRWADDNDWFHDDDVMHGDGLSRPSIQSVNILGKIHRLLFAVAKQKVFSTQNL